MQGFSTTVENTEAVVKPFIIIIITRADARRPIALYAQYLSHFLTLSLKISANQVAMTLFLKISTK